MSGIFDQIINYSPPLIVSGTVNYKGTWNASTNTPTLIDPPVASTKGDYYVVSTAGTQFSITFGVGDWIISNGTAWEKVDLTDAVSSVFGRTGAVVGVSTDYSAVGITNTAIGAANPSSGAFTSLSSSSTTTLNGTTVPASKTLVVTTDKLSALAATTSAELAGVISDETGSGALVFATSPTLVTPILGTPQSGTVTNLTGTASININGTVGATTPTTGVFTGLTVNDNTTLGSSNSDTVNFNARVASDLNPSTDNTYDLGVTGHEWRNLNIDGTANIDSLVADTADINGGTIDGTAIGATTPSTGAFTTLAIGTNAGFGGTLGQFNGSNVVIANTAGQFSVGTTNAAAADVGGSLGFTANTTSLAGYPMGNISARLIATGAGVYRSYMAFATTDAAGSVAERMRLTDTGLNSTAIGATTASTGAFTTLSATGKFTAGSGTFSAGDGSVYIGGASGLTLVGKAGSSNDVSIAAANGQNLLTNPTGTSNVVIGNGSGTISAANSLAVTGALSSTSLIVGGALFGLTNEINVGATNGIGISNTNSASSTISLWNRATTGDNVFAAFFTETSITTRGTISFNRTAGLVAYNTTSDRRSKDVFGVLNNSGSLIDGMTVYDARMKGATINRPAFIADELEQVAPFAVTGNKDAIDENGNPIMQQVSESSLVPLLVAELKSVRARLAALESK